MIPRLKYIVTFIVFIFFIISCAASRTDITGLYDGPNEFVKKEGVKVLFDFFYYTRETGRDAIVKSRTYSGVSDFNDIFYKSIRELSNLSEYQTFHNSSNDINDPVRRAERQNKIENTDYVVKLEFLQENSFSKHVLGYIVTSLSIDLIPIGYSWDYTITATIIKENNETIAKYSRSATVTNWYQMLLIALYPFHPEEAKTEEVYLESLKNIFIQIENEDILK